MPRICLAPLEFAPLFALSLSFFALSLVPETTTTTNTSTASLRQNHQHRPRARKSQDSPTKTQIKVCPGHSCACFRFRADSLRVEQQTKCLARVLSLEASLHTLVSLAHPLPLVSSASQFVPSLVPRSLAVVLRAPTRFLDNEPPQVARPIAVPASYKRISELERKVANLEREIKAVKIHNAVLLLAVVVCMCFTLLTFMGYGLWPDCDLSIFDDAAGG